MKRGISRDPLIRLRCRNDKGQQKGHTQLTLKSEKGPPKNVHDFFLIIIGDFILKICPLNELLLWLNFSLDDLKFCVSKIG